MAKNTRNRPLWEKFAYWAGFFVGLLLIIGWIWFMGWILVMFIRWWSSSFFNLGVWIYS